MPAERLLSGLDVSRETIERLQTMCEMVEKWNKTINLVSPTTVAELWDRHIMDSAQLFAFLPRNALHWVDVGSGGGFPGLVVSAYFRDHAPQTRMTLIESDQRKAVFLREASRAMGLETTVLTSRVETAEAQQADVISARALAPLSRLLSLAKYHLRLDGLAIFPKGESAEKEIADAQSTGWNFDLARHKSVTDPAGVILTLRNIQLVPTV
jgi:16S rRNA (guanine527-N7)-methyltransferase